MLPQTVRPWIPRKNRENRRATFATSGRLADRRTPQTIVDMDQTYLDLFPCALGRLVGNLWSLEWMLRNVLYRLEHPPHTSMGQCKPLFTANVEDKFPVNALTSYASLGELIDAYNKTVLVPIDRSLVTLRDTLAHGRVLCDDPVWPNLVLAKMGKPANGTVVVETSYDMSIDWMNSQIARTREALEQATARYRELGGT